MNTEKKRTLRLRHFFFDCTAVVNEIVVVVVVGNGGGDGGTNALFIISSKILSESGKHDPPRHCSVKLTNVK